MSLSLRIDGEEEVLSINTMINALIHRVPDSAAVVSRGRAVMDYHSQYW